ncbi:MAG: hypothetical protein KGJ14_12020, partial [Nitrospirota bacterium]|nr:hypothetical protein [Nitrospirota bacterium]
MWIGLAGLVLLLIPSTREFYIVEGRRWLYILLLSFAVTFTLTPILIRLGVKWGLVDQPSERKIHTTPVPRIGGL